MLSKQKQDFVRSLADSDGHIDPDKVIEAARPDDSPIHDEFEWNVDRAAAANWTETAKGLIRFVKLQVIHEETTYFCPRYAPDPDRPPKSGRHIDLTIAARNRQTAQQIMQDEIGRIVAAIGRAKRVAMILGLTDELDELLNNVEALQEQAAEKAAAKKEERAALKKGKSRAKSRASVPFMITKKMKLDLAARGMSAEQIKKLTPQQAHKILARKPKRRPPDRPELRP